MQDVFVCNFMVVIKVYQGYMYNMYLEYNSNFAAYTLWAFKSLLECKHENIHMKWIHDLNLAFEKIG
jgi:hypothetical protein